MTMRYLKFYFILFSFLIFIIGGCSQPSGQDHTKKTVYDQLLETGKIRIGYISYPPSFIKDPNSGKFSGIFYDVIEQVGKNLGIKLEYVEEVGWGTMIEALNSGRVDIVVAGIWPTSARGLKADFTRPIFYSVVRAYTSIGNSFFDGSLNNINKENIKISIIDGEMTSIIASSDFPEAKTVSLPQTSSVSQVLLEVATGKADVTFVEPAIAEQYIANNPNTIKAVEDVPLLRVFPNVMMVNKGESNFLSTLNIAITELINNGFIDKAINKYEKYPGSFERVALPYRK